MMDAEKTGRPNQRSRTRKDLLQAASRLMKQGRKPSLEEIAEEALISRATAYRYFPRVEALLLEASLDVAVPQADELFDGGSSDDPVSRLERVDTALHDMILANEASLRMMLVHSLQRGVSGRERRRAPRAPEPPHALDRGRARARPESIQAGGSENSEQGARPHHRHGSNGGL